MIIKIASIINMEEIKTGFKNFAKSIAENEGKHNLLESGMLIPTVAAGDGLADATLFHEKGKSRAREFGKGAVSGAIAGTIIGGGDVAVHHLKEYGSKLV